MDELTDAELRSQVLNFLQDFKELMCQGNYFIKSNHLKNIQALEELNLTARSRDDIILAIKVEDYYSGPIPDEYHPGYYWVFGKSSGDKEIYIKLKIVTHNNGNEKAVCIMFHPAEFPMKYPLRLSK